MTKKYFALFLALALLLSGCSLAREDAPEETGTDPGDKLIGAFVTTEHLDLFDFEAYLNDHLNEVLDGGVIEGDTSAYKNRSMPQKPKKTAIPIMFSRIWMATPCLLPPYSSRILWRPISPCASAAASMT